MPALDSMPVFLRICCAGLCALTAPVLLGQIPATLTIQGIQATVITLPAGVAFHSAAASDYLIAGGRDGYRATFAWEERESLRD